MKLLKPVTYRVKAEHEVFLKNRAAQEGHGNKALSLRMILDREMTRPRTSRLSRKSQRTRKAAA